MLVERPFVHFNHDSRYHITWHYSLTKRILNFWLFISFWEESVEIDVKTLQVLQNLSERPQSAFVHYLFLKVVLWDIAVILTPFGLGPILRGSILRPILWSFEKHSPLLLQVCKHLPRDFVLWKFSRTFLVLIEDRISIWIQFGPFKDIQRSWVTHCFSVGLKQFEVCIPAEMVIKFLEISLFGGHWWIYFFVYIMLW